MIKRALISTSDKSGVVELAVFLHSKQVEILATGGTARLLQQNDIPITLVSDYTGFPEIMGGRVKTLHPKIHGALLHRGATDFEQLAEHQIQPIDMVVLNLYPFEKVSQQADASHADIIENIDIGGPTMLRAAAKNYQHVAVVTDPSDYPSLIKQLEQTCELSLETRKSLAAKAFALVAHYDCLISNYFALDESFPATLQLDYKLGQQLRYGENPQQAAAVYQNPQSGNNSLAAAQPLQGKALSYNNLLDSDSAVRSVREFKDAACVIVKHASPCGVAISNSVLEAYKKAFAADSLSAFGGIVAFNKQLDAATANCIIESQFAEVILAPEVSPEALSILSQKKNLRVVATASCLHATDPNAMMLHSIDGGLLMQQYDTSIFNVVDLKLVTKTDCSAAVRDDVLFADTVCKFIKSNAIVLVKDKQTIGIGVGQPSRVMSLKLAIAKADEGGFSPEGAILASDAFFPFADSIEEAAKAGIKTVVQPGGSVRDAEVIEACDANGIAMLFTGMRHFRH